MTKEILIADSDRLVQETFQKIFAATPIRPLFVDNDEEALLRGRLFKPDLIIGGKALCQAVRADEELKDIPFIILLDRFDAPSHQEQKLLQADGMITKPLNEEEILSMIEDLHGKDIRPRESEEEGFSLNDSGELEEEIIELVDVVEEPEERMSIGDFAFQQKEESFGDIAPLESWEEIEKKEEGLGAEEDLSLEEKEVGLQEVSKAVAPEEKQPVQANELFEKVELEEILQKMERLAPSIEKEWPSEPLEVVSEKTPESVSLDHLPEEQLTGLREFEAALQREVKAEAPEGELQPFSMEERSPKTAEEKPPEDLSTEMELQELTEDEFPEIFLEELTEELERLEEEDLSQELETKAVEPETMEVEDLSPFLEESISEEPVIQEEVLLEEPPSEEALPMAEELFPVEEIASKTMEEPEMAAPTLTPISPVSLEELPSSFIQLDRKIEETLTREVQAMVQDFATRIIPEMTKHMLTLTVERIEAMVKGIVPELAEKAIREEIERLQKGEKD